MARTTTLWTPTDLDQRVLEYTTGEDRVWDARLLVWDVLGSLGHIEGLRASRLITDAEHARIEILNDWKIDNRKMLDEANIATVTERDGVFVLDLEYRLVPEVAYLLEKASFGGFDVQARKDGESYFATAQGKVTLPDPHYSIPELNWPAAAWYDYSIRLGNGRTVGAAVIDHPGNPPTTWHNSRRLWMLNPVITAGGPMKLRAGETLILRYRVVVHDGDTPTEVLEKLSGEYRGR